MEDQYLIYNYSFYGTDNILNRIEIYGEALGVDLEANTTLSPPFPLYMPTEEIKGSGNPFILSYDTKKKFEPICGSGAILNLISTRNFQYIKLHTDDMQKYIVKFYRNNTLYWIGWLDSELYSEILTNAIPYPVEFTAADFNILERLKFLKGEETRFNDITTLINQLKRVFDKLGLPFSKLYIGCTTTLKGITLADSETIFHKLYIQSSNFYDEDGAACKCDEVIKGILEPFGMMMVQLDANVYIYDYNTVKKNLQMKCYDFHSLAFIGTQSVNFNLGDIGKLGLAGTESSLSFEEMINNVKITSSLYGELGDSAKDREVTADNLSKLMSTDMHYPEYMRGIYGKCSNWGKDYRYIKYTDLSSDRYTENPTIVGSDVTFRDGDKPGSVFSIPINGYMLSSDTTYLKLNLKAYVNAKDNPFDDSEPIGKGDSSSKLTINAAIYTVDENDNVMQCFQGPPGRGESYWQTYSGSLPLTRLWFMAGDANSLTSVLNTWSSLRNSRGNPTGTGRLLLTDKEGLLIPLYGVAGNIVINISNTSYSVFHRTRHGDYKEWGVYGPANIFIPQYPKDLLINNFSIDIVDANDNTLKIPDVEFSSYVNAKVKTDFDEKQLIVCSANEDNLPITRGSLLIKEDENKYKCQLSYIRSGQTDILERLLMCSIHSNFSSKRKTIEIDIRGCINPSLKKTTCESLFDTEFFTMGCTIDFSNAKTTLVSSEFSEDTAKLSDIKYV
ncbi:hypothetical protein JGH11_10890 [Dysgonomonas sp. Marseille-P4677]|uniref:hypothetical protein n=1 Tax=Dysgonomonas sp. Marseille-P4677 TaxID=2364790 RepID=UPI00191462D4|nr:hypothetical protein [Dysgonomonas sp. Marseille-P4677]MBK5721379.1 hypothetical protein [Dysgonomonas sp. Marseille-P4677]